MADYQHHEQKSSEAYEDAPPAAPIPVKSEENESVEASDRGLFDFIGKKKEGEKKCDDDDVIANEFDEKVQVCEDKKEEPKEEEKKEEPKEEEKKHESLLQKLHRTGSSSSSSSDEEEVEEGGEKKKKKKGLKDKIKEKVSGEKKEDEVDKCDELPSHEPDEKKKGLVDKIKEKLPVDKKDEDVSEQPPPPPKVEEVWNATAPETEGKDKKGFLDKIKEKLPGFHHKNDEEKEKEIEKERGEETCH